MAGRLAGGDLSVRMPETGVGEIGALEHAFNDMGASLEGSRDELRRLAEEQAALRRVATLVAQRISPSGVFETVTREVGLLSGADVARMERYERDGTVTGVAGWNRSETGELAVGTQLRARRREHRRVGARGGGPARVDSFADASGPIAQEARALGIRSSVGCPIVVGGRLWGVIAASTKRRCTIPRRDGVADRGVHRAGRDGDRERREPRGACRVPCPRARSRRRDPPAARRDLHDGAQQRLVHTVVTLKLAQQRAGRRGRAGPRSSCGRRSKIPRRPHQSCVSWCTASFPPCLLAAA